MKKIILSSLAVVFGLQLFAQTTIANFDCNGSGALPFSATSTASNITASLNGTETNASYAGTATGTSAFTQNTTAGDAVSMANSGGTNTRYWTLTLGGSDLNKYINYKVYFQSEHSTTGATVITISYSTDGSTYTALSQTVAPGLNVTYTEAIVDLSSISTINNQTAVYLRFAASGASGTGTLRIDNLQIQAATSPWTMSGGNINFTGGVTATSFTATGNAKVNGTITSGASIVSSLTNSGNLNVAGTTTLTGAVTTGALTSGATTVNSLSNSGNLNVAGTTTLTGAVTTGALTSGVATVSSLNSSGNLNVTGMTTLTGVVTTNTINATHLNISGSTSFSDINATAIITSPKLVTSHIMAADTNGVHIGDSSMVFVDHPLYQAMKAGAGTGVNTTTGAGNGHGIAIGNAAVATGSSNVYDGSIAIGAQSQANAVRSFAFGHNVRANASYAMALGSGVPGGSSMINNIANSLMVGFNSNVPTLFVGGGNSSAASLGKVGIGTTNPVALLHVSSNSSNPTDYAFAVSDFVSPNSMAFAIQNNGTVNILDIASDNNALLSIAHFNGSTLKFLSNGTGDIASSGPLRPHFAGTDFGIYEGVPGSGLLRMQIASGGAVIIPALITTSGITSTGPYQPLLVDVNGKLVSNAQVTGGSSGSAWVLGGNNPTSGAAIGTTDGSDMPFITGSAGTERMRIRANGNVVVNGSFLKPGVVLGTAAGANLNYGTSYIGLNTERTSMSGSGSWIRYSDGVHNGGGIIFGDVGGGINFSPMPSVSGTTDRNFIDADVITNQTLRIRWNIALGKGQVIVGGEVPTVAPYSNAIFTVSGKVAAQEIYVVTTAGQWMDKVFKNGYQLMPLKDVENYISKNQHLPNIPSANEIEEEGQNLGKLQALEMAKIEELTLYLIELNKKVQLLEQENKKLADQIKGFKK